MSTTIAFATKHGKLAQVAPAFRVLPEWTLALAEIDTDSFGTFSGSVPRTLSPREAAIQKARAGAEQLGVDFGLGSEGTIGPHPQIPLVTADHEILALVCVSKGFEIVESHVSTEIKAYRADITDRSDLDQVIHYLDLPNHAANIYFSVNGQQSFVTGIREPEQLRRELDSLQSQSVDTISVESDFRAMNSPTRQANIAACAEKLVTRISSRCPNCDEIGWGKVGYEFGLPCNLCTNMVYSAAHSERRGCVTCNYSELVTLGQVSVDPARCDFCNP